MASDILRFAEFLSRIFFCEDCDDDGISLIKIKNPFSSIY